MPRWLTVLLVCPLVALNGWVFLQAIDYFETLITTFLAASLLAYLLDYPVRGLERLRFKRGYAVLLVFLVGLTGLSALGFFGIPVLLQELERLSDQLPRWAESAESQLQAFASWARLDPGPWGTDFEASLRSVFQSAFSNLPTLALGTFNNLLQLLFVCVLTVFFAISYRDFLRNTLERWLPGDRGTQLLQQLRRNFHRYVINQLTLAAAIASALVPTFWLLDVPFALLFGIGIGVMGLIPFCAILSIWVVSLLLALKSVWLGLQVLVVGLLIEQLIDNTLTPRILGNLTGLNPIVVLLSLMVGARVAGYLGVLVAVPVAATIKNMVAAPPQAVERQLEAAGSSPQPVARSAGTDRRAVK